MTYAAELEYFKKLLKRHNLQVLTYCPGENSAPGIDFGLRELLGMRKDYDSCFISPPEGFSENRIYKLTDSFSCSYIYFLLPDLPDLTVLIIGPYMSFNISRGGIMELSELLGIPALQVNRLEGYYENLPVISDMTPIMNAVIAFGETIWGSADKFDIADVGLPDDPISDIPENIVGGRERLPIDMQLMETRYSYENSMMEMVSQGQIHRLELMLANLGAMSFEQRASDPLRNAKNYCIICNTLLRKAAEQGGVHPVYIDEMSSVFARRIENIFTVEASQRMIAEMMRSYCRLVRKRASESYSPLIQKAILYIDADISRDLSLHSLAEQLNISDGYLSTIFRKETGRTLTEFVNEKRVRTGAHLLRTTRMQIQTVAQYCGIPDVNYFSKVFKKFIGKSPKEYRASLK